MNELLEAALSYIRRGWPVFPVHTPIASDDGITRCSCRRDSCWKRADGTGGTDAKDVGKHPRITAGHKGASTDEAQIRVWWEMWPDAGVAIRTGKTATDSYLSVLDVDSYGGGDEALDALLEKYGALPETVQVLSGGGGVHYYFEGNQPLKTTSKQLGPGLDTRGGGGSYGAGYIIAPPSLHSSGKRYALEVSSPETPAQPPQWLVELLTQSAPAASAADVSSEATQRIPDGQRKKTLLSLGRSMWAKGCSEDAIVAAILADDVARCDPPLGEKEARRIASQVTKKPRRGDAAASSESKETSNEAATGDEVEKALAALRPQLANFASGGEGRERIIYNDAFLQPCVVLYLRDPGQYEAIVRNAIKSSGVRITAWEKRIKEIAAPLQKQAALAELRERAKERGAEREFVRGDHVELARAFLADLQGDDAVAPVSDQGELHAYDRERGVWQAVETAEATRKLSTYAGALITGGEELRALSLREGDIAGALKIARQIAAREGFFGAARDGIAFSNGFVALEDNKSVLLPHAPEHRATFALPFAYDHTAQAPMWERYLREVFLGQPDVEERIALIEEWVGLVLFGLIVRYEICLVALGRNGNEGKSVLLYVLEKLFPPSTVQSVSPQKWGERFALAKLAGARINIVNEMPDADIVSGETFKAIVSGNEVYADRKNRDPFTLESRAGHLFACNDLPGTRDQSGGFWKRWIVLSFERSFAPHEQNKSLRFNIVRDELPGIAARVIKAVERFLARGYFDVPQTSQSTKAAWRLEADQVRQFLNDAETIAQIIERNELRVPSCKHPDGSNWTRASHLYEAYSVWSKANGHPALSSTKFFSRAKAVLRGDCFEARNDGKWYRLGVTGSDPSLRSNPSPILSQSECGGDDLTESDGFSSPLPIGEKKHVVGEHSFLGGFSDSQEAVTVVTTRHFPGNQAVETVTGWGGSQPESNPSLAGALGASLSGVVVERAANVLEGELPVPNEHQVSVQRQLPLDELLCSVFERAEGGSVRFAEVREQWEAYCADTNLNAGDSRWLARELEERGFTFAGSIVVGLQARSFAEGSAA